MRRVQPEAAMIWGVALSEIHHGNYVMGAVAAVAAVFIGVALNYSRPEARP